MTVGLVVGGACAWMIGVPKRQADEVIRYLTAKNYSALHAIDSRSRFRNPWSESAFVGFMKMYIEPYVNFDRAIAHQSGSGVALLRLYAIEAPSKQIGGNSASVGTIMPFCIGPTFSIGSERIATRWEYDTQISATTLLYSASLLQQKSTGQKGGSTYDPRFYEFLLREGENLRNLGCEHLYVGSKKDDIAFQIESIEQHARLEKTARHLVPIAAKYGRKMKFPPTAAELAMK